MSSGVSIVICCHNSAKELPQTLSYLATQQVRADIAWEVIIVDNSSTDKTAEVALNSWSENAPAPLKVVRESQLGLIFARYRGLAAANYEIVSYIDDDNWICREWVQTVSEVMSRHPELGACGGLNEPDFEGEQPWWWTKVHTGCYALGSQGPQEGGDITCSKARLYGAGLTIRKAALQSLLDEGFRSLLVGSQGKSLLRGEETELCFALLLAGWRFWYEPRLQLRHHLTSDRLQWRYLRRLCRGGGASTVGLDPYRFAIERHADYKKISFWWNVGSKKDSYERKQTWQWQTFVVLRDLLNQPIKLLLSFIFSMEGDPDVLNIERKIGRLSLLLQKRKAYDMSIKALQETAWKKNPRLESISTKLSI